jgi:hypothetical protein
MNLRRSRSPHINATLDNNPTPLSHSVPSPLSHNTSLAAAADTGASGHYFALRHANILRNVRVTSHPVTVTLPNGHRISSTHVGELRITGLGPSARTVPLFRNTDLAHYPLLSISQICDSGNLKVIYNANSVCVRTIDTQCIQMVGSRHHTNDLYLIDASHPTQPHHAQSGMTLTYLRHLTWLLPSYTMSLMRN